MDKKTAFLFAGGVAALLAWRRSSDVEDATTEAIDMGGDLSVRLTGYWPFASGLNAAQRLMEGGTKDRKGAKLYTYEDHVAGLAPYVSVAGDYRAWPYGQRIVLDFAPSLVFRVVDTGGHFFGAGKLYRLAGSEPLDICVATSGSKKALGIPTDARATIVRGDTLDAKRDSVNASYFTGQTGVV